MTLMECCEDELPGSEGRLDTETFVCTSCEQEWIWFDLDGKGGWYRNGGTDS